MATVDELDSHLIKTGCQYEAIGQSTWVLAPDSAHPAQIVVRADDPIVLFTLAVLDLAPDVEGREALFRTLLELNSELLHTSYSLEGDRVVLSGAQQLENLDFNEFQAMIDDMCMALDNHWNKLSEWGLKKQRAANAAEGSA